jgi:hypothetical protein
MENSFSELYLPNNINRKTIQLSEAKGVPTFSNNRKLDNTRHVHIE